MLEIGRVGIIAEVSMMASQMAIPREVHLEAVLYVFAFLCQNYNSRMELYNTYPIINISDFKYCKWNYFYCKLKETIPSNAYEES